MSSVGWGDDLLHPGGIGAVGEFLKESVSPNVAPEFISLTIKAMWLTLVYAVAGLCLAILIGLPLGVLASGILYRKVISRIGTVVGIRLALGFFRSIHELVWAMMFVAAIGLSPMTAIIALAIPYAGILGRIYADILNDVPCAPLQALRTGGASELQVFLYGRIPMALPDMLSYTFYRFECAIRSSAIMGFVGLGGLGMQIQLSLGDLFYDQVWTLIYALVVMIALVDMWSTWLRKSLTS